MKNNIDKFLKVFSSDIRSMMAASDSPASKPNVILTGSNVLALHGLNISWTPQDLDVAIYGPSKAQRVLIFSDEEFEACLAYEEAQEKGLHQRAWKKQVFHEGETLTLNFILEQGPSPKVNLHYSFGGLYLPVQNIDTIIAAKLSYGEGRDKSFLRRKDAFHLSELKSLNFNVSFDESIHQRIEEKEEVLKELPPDDLPF